MHASLPPTLEESLHRLNTILSEEAINQIIAIQSAPLLPGIRFNPLKTTSDSAIEDLSTRYRWRVKPIPFCDDAYLIQTAEFPPGKTIEHRLGNYYLQDASSMVPVSLMDFHEENLLILDMAASPGGKTTHLVARSNDKSFILANDASQGRIPALRSVLANWGGICLAVTNFPGENFGNWYPETFDKVLLDAPCSMENLRPTPNHPLRETTSAERLRLQDRQVQLLISGLQSLKLGGQMVYATCSLAPEEDEAVINRVLQAYPNTFRIMNVERKLPFKVPGLTSFNGDVYDPELTNAVRLWPHITGMSGFFCALIEKTNPLPFSVQPPPERAFSRTHLVPVSFTNKARLCQVIFDTYGFDLYKLMDNLRLSLFTRYEALFLIPEVYLERFQQLPFTFIGMMIGNWQQDVFQPSVEFISRFGKRFSTGFIKIDNDQIDAWITGRDIRYPQCDLKPAGQYLVVLDSEGRNLGLGKLLPRRLRNMLPRW